MHVRQSESLVVIECSEREARQLALTLANQSSRLYTDLHALEENGLVAKHSKHRLTESLARQENDMAQMIFDEVGF